MKNKTILMLGVGGVSMHQLALAYINDGCVVYGYDLNRSVYTDMVEDAGVQFTTHFNKDFLHVDMCVRTGAIKDDNKYIQALKKLKVPIIDRAEALGEICKNFKCVIAVAGTHGKSTTCSLIYEILREAGKAVSCHIGADVFAPRFNLLDDYLVVEACEYNKSFLSLRPTISVITNVEPEHMDSYKSMFNLRLAFKTFLSRAKDRFVFDEKSTQFLKKSNNVSFIKQTKLDFEPKLKGEYNLNNISVAIEVCKFLGVKQDVIKKTVKSFEGIPRRYEFKGNLGKRKVYIDYAHHPTELNAFISVFLEENKDAYIVFQPHTYSRTKLLLNEFLKVFKEIKNLIIFKEYPAREKPSAGLSAYELYLKLKEINPNVKYCATAKGVVKNLNDCGNVAFVGAGDINQIAQKILTKYTCLD